MAAASIKRASIIDSDVHTREPRIVVGYSDAEATCVPLDWIMQLLGKKVKSGVLLVFLDACRECDEGGAGRARGGSAAGRGLTSRIAGLSVSHPNW
jgi:hypothetical protein